MHSNDTSPTDQPRPQILLALRDPAMLTTLATHTREAGYDAISARDGLRALAMVFGGTRPSVLVADLRLPQLDGATLVRRLRSSESLCSTPVIMLVAGPARPDEAVDADLWLRARDPFAVVAAIDALVRDPPAPRAVAELSPADTLDLLG